MKGIAVFDFDGTISFRDSFLDFIRFTHGGTRLLGCVALNIPFIIIYYIGLYPSHKLKQRFFSYFYKGFGQEILERKGIEYCEKRIDKIIYPGAKKRIAWHHSQGHKIYLLTASSGLWLGEWCKINGISLIGTEFEVVDGRYTGRISGKNCRGKEKARKLQIEVDLGNSVETYGYGDSKSDKDFLALVSKPFHFPLNEKNMNKLITKIKP
jgi:phosphatidylglycerophosphatase C